METPLCNCYALEQNAQVMKTDGHVKLTAVYNKNSCARFLNFIKLQ